MHHLRLAAVIALAVGANLPLVPAAPIPKHLMPKEQPPCYLMRVGDRRVSDWNGSKIASVVTKVEQTPDGTVVRVETEDAAGKRTPEETVRVSAKGVEVLEFGGSKLDPTFWWFKLPHADNNTWSDGLAGQNWTGKTIGWEDIEVPAGKYRALHIQHIDAPPAARKTDYWFAPGMGDIKWSNGTDGREMTEFKSGK